MGLKTLARRHPMSWHAQAVSQGPELDEVGIVTLRFSLRRCGEAVLRTTDSHDRDGHSYLDKWKQ